MPVNLLPRFSAAGLCAKRKLPLRIFIESPKLHDRAGEGVTVLLKLIAIRRESINVSVLLFLPEGILRKRYPP
jgi:hypothetical protein